MDDFIGEEVELEGDLEAFTWRGERYAIARVLWRGRQLDFGRRWWQRRHMDRVTVRTEGGEEFELRRVKERKGRVWRLYKRMAPS